jgi:putative transposase
MPVPQKKSTTTNTDPVGSEQVSPVLPPQHTFHEHLRALARNAVRVVIEEVMREELRLFLGAAWGESTPERKGYRNGSYTRDLATSSGPIEDLAVPRDREGQFHTQVFDRYQRYEPQVAEGLTQMFVAGVSTHKVGEVAQTLMGVAPSASAVSRLNHSLTEQFETWRERPLQAHWRILYLDGIHFEVRHGDQTDSTILLTALGVDLEGNKEVLALCACAEESKEGWIGLLQDVRRRGTTQVDLIVTDGHDGLLAAVSALFAATPRERSCGS